MPDFTPSRRELSSMIGRQGMWLVLLTVAFAGLVMALLRKGVLTWSDLAHDG